MKKWERNMLVRKMRLIVALGLVLVLWLPLFAQNTGSGRIVGKVVDAESGDATIGASIMIEGSKLGTAANLNGEYVINNVPAGSYRVIVSAVGRVKTIIDSVKVIANQPTRIDLALDAAEIVGKQVIVEAARVYNTDASMLKQREMSTSVSDAISAQTISQTGANDAAAAMSRITGASVVGGKYVLIRGLGDRYANTQLNGSLLPSTDPERPSVQMDLIPASLLDNIVVQKTSTPDKPGDFTGGSVNMNAKALPDHLVLQYSTSTSYNSQSTFKDILTQPGGSRDWLGLGASTRERPDIEVNEIPNYSMVQKDSAGAAQLEAISKLFNNDFSLRRSKAPLNQSHAFTFGNQYSLWERPIGVLANVTYGRNYAYYDDGTIARWDAVIGGKELSKAYYLRDVKGTEEVQWGALAQLTYHLGTSSIVSVNYNRNQSGEKSTRWLYGELPRDFSEGTIWETRTLQYTERSMSAFQLKGGHMLNWFSPIRIEWRLAETKNTQDDPDLRYFSSDYSPSEDGKDTVYNISPSNYPMPAHYFRLLEEKNREGALDITVPLSHQYGGNKLKIGLAFLDKSRDQTEHQYEVINPSYSTTAHYNGNTEWYFGPANIGVIGWDPRGQRYLFGNVVTEAVQYSSIYSGDQTVLSFYGMTELGLTKRLDLIAGARVEHTDMTVVSKDPTKPAGRLDLTDLLPSANLIYHLGNKMNLRGAFGISVARPTIREMAPFSNFEFINGYRLTGNPTLTRSRIENYDLRWEWFPGPGEVIAVSGFYKNFHDPIERFQLGLNLEVNFENVPEARVLGAEFEFRKKLDAIHLPNFTLNGNLTLVHSRVSLDANELGLNRSIEPDAPDHRAFGGQSPYLVNLDLAYDNMKSGTIATLAYNVFGARLYDNVLGLTPDIYERPRNMLDFVGSQRVWGGIKASFSAKNILDAKTLKSYEFLGKEYVSSESSAGRTYSFGLSYEL